MLGLLFERGSNKDGNDADHGRQERRKARLRQKLTLRWSLQ